MNVSRVVVIAMMVGACGSVASADLLSVSALDARASAQASVSTTLGSDGASQVNTATLFSELPVSADAVGSVLDGSASANANAGGSRGFNVVSAYGDAMGSAYAPPEGTANGSGFAQFEFTFTLSGTTDFALTWFMDVGGSGNIGYAEVALFDGANNAIFYRAADSFGGIDGLENGVLGAGTYRLYAYAGGGGFGGGSDFNSDANASFNISMSVIPAPGAMGVLGLGGLVAMRRRRG